MKFYKLLAKEEYKDDPVWYETYGEPVYINGREMFFDQWVNEKGETCVELTDGHTGILIYGGAVVTNEDTKEVKEYLVEGTRYLIEHKNLCERLDEVIEKFEASPLYNKNHKYPIAREE